MRGVVRPHEIGKKECKRVRERLVDLEFVEFLEIAIIFLYIHQNICILPLPFVVNYNFLFFSLNVMRSRTFHLIATP